MKEWFKEHWFLVKSYLWSGLIQILFLAGWDWYVPHTQWGYNLPFFVKYIPAVIVFGLAHYTQVGVHMWRRNKKLAKETNEKASS